MRVSLTSVSTRALDWETRNIWKVHSYELIIETPPHGWFRLNSSHSETYPTDRINRTSIILHGFRGFRIWRVEFWNVSQDYGMTLITRACISSLSYDAIKLKAEAPIYTVVMMLIGWFFCLWSKHESAHIQAVEVEDRSTTVACLEKDKNEVNSCDKVGKIFGINALTCVPEK